MPLKIATWNLCLGIFHKKDYVRHILEENQIDVISLQETEISKDTDLENLKIRGYTLEVEENDEKMRIASYIKNGLHYRRRHDLEEKNRHLMIIDIETNPQTRIITIYRTFKTQQQITSRDHFKLQLQIINRVTTDNTLLLGDFNLDEKKTLQYKLQPTKTI